MESPGRIPSSSGKPPRIAFVRPGTHPRSPRRDTMSPMNPDLYEALRQVFGHVVVVKHGEAFGLAPRPMPVYRNGKLAFKQDVREYGESYRIDCPYCNDTRQRLWIPYMWA